MRLPLATWRGANSANFSVGRAGHSIKYVTVHHTAANNTSLATLYANAARQGSAHFFVSDSRIEQYVDTNDTAWTNGNLTSNRESITIETNGNWQNGYYNQATLDNLTRLFAELRRHWPGAQITYHKDVSTKATACPCDLKDKGYAKAAWDKAITQGDSMILSTEAVKTLYRHLFKREGDPGGVTNYTGKTLDAALKDMTGSAEYRAVNTVNNTVTVEKPVEVFVDRVVEKIVEVPVEVVKEVQVVVEKPVPLADLTMGQLFEALIKKITGR